MNAQRRRHKVWNSLFYSKYMTDMNAAFISYLAAGSPSLDISPKFLPINSKGVNSRSFK